MGAEQLRTDRGSAALGFTGQGDPVQVLETEVLARCLQHETDHPDGALLYRLYRPDGRGQRKAYEGNQSIKV